MSLLQAILGDVPPPGHSNIGFVLNPAHGTIIESVCYSPRLFQQGMTRFRRSCCVLLTHSNVGMDALCGIGLGYMQCGTRTGQEAAGEVRPVPVLCKPSEGEQRLRMESTLQLQIPCAKIFAKNHLETTWKLDKHAKITGLEVVLCTN